MSGALNSRSTFAWRVGTGGALLAGWLSCEAASFVVAIPATIADTVVMNARRLTFIRPPLEDKLQAELENAWIARARIGARDPTERRLVVDGRVRNVEADHRPESDSSRRSPGARRSSRPSIVGSRSSAAPSPGRCDTLWPGFHLRVRSTGTVPVDRR